MKKPISSKFPFKSNFIDIKGSKMHYVDVGRGDPILFLHGNPTSSYLWRNIIPYLQTKGRCIAPDLIGMGKSDKPDIDYTYDDHYKYLVDFIEKLGLKNITLVIHDWGSGLGFRYAYDHKNNIKGIAFMEAMVKPMKSSDLPSDLKIPFLMMRMPVFSWLMISVMNMFLKMMVPKTIVRKLTAEEFQNYQDPYPTISSRKPVQVWPSQVPIDGKPKHSHDVIESYSQWLQKSKLPKLFFYAHPGGILKKEDVEWVKKNIPNVKSVDIGKGIHFIQEDNPHQIGSEIAAWYSSL